MVLNRDGSWSKNKCDSKYELHSLACMAPKVKRTNEAGKSGKGIIKQEESVIIL